MCTSMYMYILFAVLVFGSKIAKWYWIALKCYKLVLFNGSSNPWILGRKDNCRDIACWYGLCGWVYVCVCLSPKALTSLQIPANIDPFVKFHFATNKLVLLSSKRYCCRFYVSKFHSRPIYHSLPPPLRCVCMVCIYRTGPL